MFWIFGGGWVIGDATEFGWYEGTYLTTHHNVILVSPNYRVGPFGFMALNSLRSQDPNNSTGNAGLQDQTMALRWVHDNIAAFGAFGAARASATRGRA
jgi:para-nitrobenzyl esterase